MVYNSGTFCLNVPTIQQWFIYIMHKTLLMFTRTLRTKEEHHLRIEAWKQFTHAFVNTPEPLQYLKSYFYARLWTVLFLYQCALWSLSGL